MRLPEDGAAPGDSAASRGWMAYRLPADSGWGAGNGLLLTRIYSAGFILQAGLIPLKKSQESCRLRVSSVNSPMIRAIFVRYPYLTAILPLIHTAQPGLAPVR